MKPGAGGGDRAGLAWVAAHRAVHRRSLPEGLGQLHRLGWAAGMTPRGERPWSRLGILEAPKGWSFGDRDSSIQQGGGDYGVSLCLPTRDAFVNKAGPRTAAAGSGERQTSACGSELREATRGQDAAAELGPKLGRAQDSRPGGARPGANPTLGLQAASEAALGKARAAGWGRGGGGDGARIPSHAAVTEPGCKRTLGGPLAQFPGSTCTRTLQVPFAGSLVLLPTRPPGHRF